MVQDDFEVFFARFGDFEVNHGFVDEDELMLKDVFTGDVSFPRVNFPNFDFVAVVLSEASEFLRIFFGGGLFFGAVPVAKNLDPVVNAHIIGHVIGELFVVVLELDFLFLSGEAFQFQ